MLLLMIVCANVANLLLVAGGLPAEGVRDPVGPRSAPQPGRPTVAHRDAAPGGGRSRGRPAAGHLDGTVVDLMLPPVDFPVDLGAGLNGPTIAFTLAVVVAATVASGLPPALLAARGDLSGVLNEGGRGGIGGSRSHRLRALLVGIEVALALVAVVGAGLFLRSFQNVSRIEPGFAPETSSSPVLPVERGLQRGGAVGLLPHVARADGSGAGSAGRDLLRLRAARIPRLESGGSADRGRLRPAPDERMRVLAPPCPRDTSGSWAYPCSRAASSPSATRGAPP